MTTPDHYQDPYVGLPHIPFTETKEVKNVSYFVLWLFLEVGIEELYHDPTKYFLP